MTMMLGERERTTSSGFREKIELVEEEKDDEIERGLVKMSKEKETRKETWSDWKDDDEEH